MERARIVPREELEARISISREIAREPAPAEYKLPPLARAAIVVGGAALLWSLIIALGYAILNG